MSELQNIMDHKILWEESTIEEFENWLKRKTKEAIWIKWTVNALNTDPGIDINPTWNMMLLKRTERKESRCQDSVTIDEIPSRENTGQVLWLPHPQTRNSVLKHDPVHMSPKPI